MPAMSHSSGADPSALRHLLAERGAGALPSVSELTRRSWQRSLAAGLAPSAPARPQGLSAGELRALIDREGQFLSYARPVMEHVFSQVAGGGNVVILACGDGTVVNALGDPTFLDKAARVALQPGHSWHEASRGTNAIGTALAEDAPVTVHGEEHFLERHAFLTCTAAPVHDPRGQILGVIDISGDWTTRSRHTEALVRLSAQMIETQIFHARHRPHHRLYLHASAEGLGSAGQIALALDEAGRVIGANHAARAAFARLDLSAGPMPFEHLLGFAASALEKRAAANGVPFQIRLAGGRIVHAEFHAPPAIRAKAPAAAFTDDALTALDTGDGAFRDVLARARRLAGKPVPLLLLGESGTGKDVLARAIHRAGPRRGGAFVAVNCAALPEMLIEAELFGYRPGAFTGAAREGNPGRLREANGGTLFLDEIGDMPITLQTRLLQVLESREVVPLGGGKPVRLDFALISATHHDLPAAVAAGRFRADLYYRLAGTTLSLPPLRARTDLPALIERVLARLVPGGGITLAPDLGAALAAYAWPGNIRELANVLSAAVALLDPDERQVACAHLCPEILARLAAKAQPAANLAEPARPLTLRGLSHAAIREALTHASGNVSEAARRLAISRKTLYRKLREAERVSPA